MAGEPLVGIKPDWGSSRSTSGLIQIHRTSQFLGVGDMHSPRSAWPCEVVAHDAGKPIGALLDRFAFVRRPLFYLASPRTIIRASAERGSWTSILPAVLR